MHGDCREYKHEKKRKIRSIWVDLNGVRCRFLLKCNSAEWMKNTTEKLRFCNNLLSVWFGLLQVNQGRPLDFCLAFVSFSAFSVLCYRPDWREADEKGGKLNYETFSLTSNIHRRGETFVRNWENWIYFVVVAFWHQILNKLQHLYKIFSLIEFNSIRISIVSSLCLSHFRCTYMMLTNQLRNYNCENLHATRSRFWCFNSNVSRRTARQFHQLEHNFFSSSLRHHSHFPLLVFTT